MGLRIIVGSQLRTLLNILGPGIPYFQQVLPEKWTYNLLELHKISTRSKKIYRCEGFLLEGVSGVEGLKGLAQGTKPLDLEWAFEEEGRGMGGWLRGFRR